MFIAGLFLDKKGRLDKISSYWQGDIDEIFEILSDKRYSLFSVRKVNKKAKYSQGLYGYTAWMYYSLTVFDKPCGYKIQTYMFGTKVEAEMKVLDNIFIPLQKQLKNLHAEKTVTIYDSNEIFEVFITPKLNDILVDL